MSISPIHLMSQIDSAMTDREIAEETLLLMRHITLMVNQIGPLIEQAGPMLDALASSPMGSALMRMGGK